MAADGYKKYQRAFAKPPALVVEWHDHLTAAVGWLCIDSLRGGAAGGGTRMRGGKKPEQQGSREEAIFLAKTMGVKFRVCGPDIGGGKSVIRFDPAAHAKDKSKQLEIKRGVLERWYAHIGPYLKSCYGTGGDVNVDEVSEATAIPARVVGILHPQEGICRGHMTPKDGEEAAAKVARLKHGCESRVELADLPGPREGAWVLADVVTGFGVARSIQRFYAARQMKLEGQRAVIEGFGAVGAFAAYYLHHMGVRTVATSSKGGEGFRVAIDPAGLDVVSLIKKRDGNALETPPKRKNASVIASAKGEEIYDVEAEIYVPAGASHTINGKKIKSLSESGVKVWSCGANNPFRYDTKQRDLSSWVLDMLDLQKKADKKFAILPDFVANCGMARAFAYLMSAGSVAEAPSILSDAGATIDQAVDKVLEGHSRNTGLLGRGYQVYIEE